MHEALMHIIRDEQVLAMFGGFMTRRMHWTASPMTRAAISKLRDYLARSARSTWRRRNYRAAHSFNGVRKLRTLERGVRLGP
jgi:hypothetical protein